MRLEFSVGGRIEQISKERRVRMSVFVNMQGGSYWAGTVSLHGDALCEIAGLVDVAPAQNGDMIGQELEWYHGKEGRE